MDEFVPFLYLFNQLSSGNRNKLFSFESSPFLSDLNLIIFLFRYINLNNLLMQGRLVYFCGQRIMVY